MRIYLSDHFILRGDLITFLTTAKDPIILLQLSKQRSPTTLTFFKLFITSLFSFEAKLLLRHKKLSLNSLMNCLPALRQLFQDNSFN